MEIQSVIELIELPKIASEFASANPELAVLRAENARLKHEMAQVRAIARIAVEQPDTHTLAKLISQQAAECMQTRQAWIGLVADDAIRVEAICDDNHVQPGDGLTILPGENGAGLVLLKRHTVICVDATRDPLMTPEFCARFGCRSVLSVPMLDHQNEILGVMQWHDRADGAPFSEADTATAEMIAMQAAVAFERSRIHTHLQQWVNSIESLFAFNTVINERLNPDLLMQRLVEHAVGFLGADGGLAGWVMRDAGASTTHTTRISARQYFHGGVWHSIQREWSLNEGAPGWVYVYHCPYLANDYPQDLQADALWRDQFGVHYALCVPIVDAESQVLGFIELHKSAGRLPFAWLDAGFLESLANISAIAISNAQLMQALEASRQQAAALSAEHVTWMEEERRSLARELHDETGQVLIGIKLGLQVLAKKIPTAQHNLQQEVARLREQINQAAVQLKSTARMLRPPTLDELGLPAALRQLAIDFEARVGVQVQVSADVGARPSQPTETAFYRIAQEALTNAVRHGGAKHVRIELAERANTLALAVQDDGSGFELQQVAPSGLGLLGMRERATMLGGNLTIESAPTHGTRIVATAPLGLSLATRLTEAPST